MSVSYFFHPEASDEHLAQVAYYENQLAGLGRRYIAAFSDAMAHVCNDPVRFPIDAETGIRRLRIRDFPFTVFFRDNAGTIEVLAVAPHKRQPGYWLDRAQSPGRILQQERAEYKVGPLQKP